MDNAKKAGIRASTKSAGLTRGCMERLSPDAASRPRASGEENSCSGLAGDAPGMRCDVR